MLYDLAMEDDYDALETAAAKSRMDAQWKSTDNSILLTYLKTPSVVQDSPTVLHVCPSNCFHFRRLYCLLVFVCCICMMCVFVLHFMHNKYIVRDIVLKITANLTPHYCQIRVHS